MFHCKNQNFQKIIGIIGGSKMESVKKKLLVLSNIAEKLNQRNLTWAIGGSLLLYFKGIMDQFHDIDIMVAEEDAEKLKEIILTFGYLLPPDPKLQYKTKQFLEFIVEGVDIDVMAGFTIVNKEKEYYFPLRPGSVNDFTEVNGVVIPLHSVTEWRKYYELMGRTEKVKMIDRWL